MSDADLDAAFDSDYEHFMRVAHDDEFNRREAQLIAEVAELTPGMSVLDAPCGYGRISLELARRGLRVHGVDRRSPLVESALADADRAGLGITAEVADLSSFHSTERFDAAVMWFTSFGYGSDEASRAMLRNLRGALRPGGRLLIDTFNPLYQYARAHSQSPQFILWPRVGSDLMLDRFTIEHDAQRVLAQRTVVRDGEVRDFSWSLRLLVPGEYRQWLADAGFVSVGFHDEQGGPFDWTKRRMVVVARAPESDGRATPASCGLR
ncbi:SAM-dependent methyltransferase [Streptomyces sp. NPDC059176]|uniref:SAM-dependent methyltransferase n=1 Tax=unclassified Streptomyces TaxID=2593676 RepID=UPI00367B1C4C